MVHIFASYICIGSKKSIATPLHRIFLKVFFLFHIQFYEIVKINFKIWNKFEQKNTNIIETKIKIKMCKILRFHFLRCTWKAMGTVRPRKVRTISGPIHSGPKLILHRGTVLSWPGRFQFGRRNESRKWWFNTQLCELLQCPFIFLPG